MNIEVKLLGTQKFSALKSRYQALILQSKVPAVDRDQGIANMGIQHTWI